MGFLFLTLFLLLGSDMFQTCVRWCHSCNITLAYKLDWTISILFWCLAWRKTLLSLSKIWIECLERCVMTLLPPTILQRGLEIRLSNHSHLLLKKTSYNNNYLTQAHYFITSKSYISLKLWYFYCTVKYQNMKQLLFKI